MNKKELIKKIQQKQRRVIELQKKMFLSKKFLWTLHVSELNDILNDEEFNLCNIKGDYEVFKETVK